jgi:hypothetical protein
VAFQVFAAKRRTLARQLPLDQERLGLAWTRGIDPSSGLLLLTAMHHKLSIVAIVAISALELHAQSVRASFGHAARNVTGDRLRPSSLTAAGQIPPKAQRTPEQQKIDSRLLDAIARRETNAGAPDVPGWRSGLDVDDGDRVLVDITGTVTEAVLDEIEKLDGQVVSEFPRFDAIRARLPLERLESLARRAEVRSIRPADIAIARPDAVPTPGKPAGL